MATTILVLKNVPPYDGEHEIVTSGFTTREYHQIKQICGLRAGEIEDGLNNADVGLVVALAAVILQRQGHQVNLEILWNATDEDIDVKLRCPHCQALNDKPGNCSSCGKDLGGDEGRPLATATSGGATSALVAPESQNVNDGSSGSGGSDAGA